jgi:hypothetical protein
MDTIAIPSAQTPLVAPNFPGLVADIFDVYMPDTAVPGRYKLDADPLFAIRIPGSSRYIGKTFRSKLQAVRYLSTIADLERTQQLAEMARLSHREMELDAVLRARRMRKAVGRKETDYIVEGASRVPPRVFTVEGVVIRIKKSRAAKSGSPPD